ncbi:radial spoke head protein 3 homolog B-like [Mytilus californianus]|uniref:radial spoke head protein 3 homolog B-like n=1 Tax=Mytilus californianus TaxID=6549 RepID=UPI002247A418|nr:radial spoke head protein 3 homolog B-like [Mytilus californianus]XP_052088993.1 radial spoke head protein 3 homolog B-like [Mytilus californianus]
MAAVLPQKPQGTYTFASQPRAVQQRKKYRDGMTAPAEQQSAEGVPLYGNIMYDRRIVRGNTYAQHTLPAHAQPDPIEIQRQQENRRRAIARKRAKEQLRPRSPEAVEGRKHIDVQTELYLEELSDRVEEADVEVQTDAFLDRPPSPMFVPAKTGVDIMTQILDGDLFDFDIEVKPILEVLVGKTVEQALLEVMEEEELSNLRSQQRAFEELRNAELVEQQRLEEQERRHREEKERRMRQQREIAKKEKETSDKIAARAFAQSYLADLVPTVFGTLSDNGYFYDPVERDLEQGFMPWLMDQVTEQLKKSELGRMVLDGILREVVSKRMDLYAKIGQKPAVSEQQEQQQTEEKPQDTTQNAVPPSASATSEGEKPVEQAESEQKADEGGEPEQEQQADDDAGGDD